MKVLHDGWPLVYAPDSPAALHLLALLDCCPQEVEAFLALPGEPPYPAPGGAALRRVPVKDTPIGRLGWEQHTLPGIASALGAALIHYTSGSPALVTARRGLLSPAEAVPELDGPLSAPARDWLGPWSEPAPSLARRARQALVQGGYQRLCGLLWPADLPAPRLSARLVRLPPFVHPDFAPGAVTLDSLPDLDLPDAYFLCHGASGLSGLRRILAAWEWAAGPLSGQAGLVVVGMDAAAREQGRRWLAEAGSEANVRLLEPVSPQAVAALYLGCTAVFHPDQEPAWGGPLRLALSCGKPVVALETPLADALVGPAAYLVPASPGRATTARMLGAALITLAVEDPLQEALAEAAITRSAAWQPAGRPEAVRQALLGAYQELA